MDEVFSKKEMPNADERGERKLGFGGFPGAKPTEITLTVTLTLTLTLSRGYPNPNLNPEPNQPTTVPPPGIPKTPRTRVSALEGEGPKVTSS